MDNKAINNQKMNKFGLSTKLLVSFLLLVLTAAFLLNAAIILSAVKSDFYNSSSPDNLIRRDLTSHLKTLAANDLLELAEAKSVLRDARKDNLYTQYTADRLEDQYSAQRSNIAYKLSDSEGSLLASNFQDPPESPLASYLTENAGYPTDEVNHYRIELYVRGDLQAHDYVYYIDTIYRAVFEMRYAAIVLCILCFLLCAAGTIFLCTIVGRRKGELGARINFFDRIPFEIIACIYLFALSCIFILADTFSYYTAAHFNIALQVILTACVYVALFVFMLPLLLTVVNRIKTRTFWRSFLFVRLCCLIGRGFRWVWRALRSAFKNKFVFFISLLLLFASAITDLFMLTAYTTTGGGYFLWLLKNTVIAGLLLYAAYCQMKLADGSEKILKGDLSHKLDTKPLCGNYKPIAENLNHIGDGLSLALAEQVKSERMKTELITNVSHDLKTPLTCIINYVDLLKAEPIESEKAKEYIAILEKQSARLKKLTEDLVETSKAASGSIPVHQEQVDLAILLSQAVGEYKDRFEARSLTTVLDIGSPYLYALCDGRLTWRIIDNLLGNAAKYSLPGTRIYITALQEEKATRITVKNISESQLNITPEELTERFVRGDSSRNTEGSGLGLSIAKSLAELQHGSLTLRIDGDLFTAILELGT